MTMKENMTSSHLLQIYSEVSKKSNLCPVIIAIFYDTFFMDGWVCKMILGFADLV